MRFNAMRFNAKAGRLSAGLGALLLALPFGMPAALAQDIGDDPVVKIAPANPDPATLPPEVEDPIPTAVQSDASPVVAAAFAKLMDNSFASRARKEDIAAAEVFYGARKDPLWIAGSGFNDNAKAVIAEIAKAAEWGLDPRAFYLPAATASLETPAAQGEAEAQLTLAALTYARHARGGRVHPPSISQMLDLKPPVKKPKTVLEEIAAAGDPALYLTDQHPKHEQFKLLRAELLRRMGPVEPEPVEDESLSVKIPAGATIKPGSLHPDIALLRRRLKVPADFAGRETLLDEKLTDALKAFQTDKGLKVSGQLNARTRTALNAEGEAGKAENPRDTQRLAVNMERWRWMPEDLGSFHVINNVPEYMTRSFKDGKVVFKEKIIVGLPTWPTPSFSAEMKTIVYNPSWGVPDGIKAKELKPRLQRAGGGGFFEQLFGGGGGGASVLKAYGLTVYRNGKVIDPNSVDWSTADLRAYSFIQPPGAQNPLGFVKFMFPNSHDVYMHDTSQRDLFAQSKRPYSHGCIRVNNPQRFAEVLLAEDKGWSADRAEAARRSSETITLDRHIWVHSVYLTAWAEEDGKIATFGDVYGLDSRVSRALGGSAIPSRDEPLETASIGDDGEAADTGEPKPAKKKSNQKQKKQPSSTYRVPQSLSETMSGLIAN